MSESTNGPGRTIINGSRKHMIARDGIEISIQYGLGVYSRPAIYDIEEMRGYLIKVMVHPIEDCS